MTRVGASPSSAPVDAEAAIAAMDRDALAALLSTMSFREIAPGDALNHDHDIGGDEAQSLLEHVCDHFGIDKDLFWSKVDFGATFFSESHPLLIPVVVAVVMVRKVLGLRTPEPDRTAPFTTDDLLRILADCATEQAAARRSTDR